MLFDIVKCLKCDPDKFEINHDFISRSHQLCPEFDIQYQRWHTSNSDRPCIEIGKISGSAAAQQRGTHIIDIRGNQGKYQEILNNIRKNINLGKYQQRERNSQWSQLLQRCPVSRRSGLRALKIIWTDGNGKFYILIWYLFIYSSWSGLRTF